MVLTDKISCLDSGRSTSHHAPMVTWEQLSGLRRAIVAGLGWAVLQ